MLRGWHLFGLGGLVLVGGSVALAQQAPDAGKMLEYRPRHEAVCTTPTAAELASCKVELDKGKGGGSGWILKDGSGKTVRRFFSSNGRSVDTYSYYKDGVEVYRESVSSGSRVPDTFRWFNSGGSKHGVDDDRNGTIDTWKAISPEEVSQEVLRALATRDLRRLEALLITDDDIRTLGLSSDMAESLKGRRKGIKAKFEATIAKLPKLTEKAVWQHLETSAPQSIPAEQIGAKSDIVRHSRGTVLFESGGSNDWFQVGQMIQVGSAWKVIDAPTAGPAYEERIDGGSPDARSVSIGDDPKLQKMIEKLTKLDEDSRKMGSSGASVVKHHLDRADILEQIVGSVKPRERDPWIRQVADSLSSAVQAGPTDKVPATRLASLEEQLVKHMPSSNLAAYVSFRRMQADYSVQLGAGEKINFEKVQQDWLAKLTTFVKTYPSAEDTPDAMLQLGMVCEFLGKDVDAKNWYAELARKFPDKPQAPKATGAVRRLDLEGKTFVLAGPLLTDSNTAYDVDQARGKVALVYYWASWNGQASSDFKKLKSVVERTARTWPWCA